MPRAQSLRREQIFIAVSMAAGLTAIFYVTDFYLATQMTRGREFWSPSLAWDRQIPFVPQWIWVYLLYFPLCFLPLFFKELHNDCGVFRRSALGFLGQFAVAFMSFWLFPSRMQQALFERTNLSEWVVARFYQLDPGFNIFPSLHVANVAFIACLTWRLRGKMAGTILWLLTLLIAASTLFVKQHYFLDLPAGLMLGTCCYQMAFSRMFAFTDSRQDGSISSPSVKCSTRSYPPPLSPLRGRGDS